MDRFPPNHRERQLADAVRTATLAYGKVYHAVEQTLKDGGIPTARQLRELRAAEAAVAAAKVTYDDYHDRHV